MARQLQYTKLLTDDTSFQLVRTNPKLTGNLKLTVNESGDIWLNSIKANLELAKDDYSRFPIDITQSLPANVYQFFKNGSTPNEIIFSLTEAVDLTKTSKDFKDQFDFSNYFSGIKYFPSNKYDERLAYFAPLYLKETLPDYFIIFKIKNPLNAKVDQVRQKYESGQSREEYLRELFSQATIAKTFELGEKSKIGQYLRAYLNNPNFPVSPLTVGFEENEYTTWNGILVNSGVFGSRGELLYQQYIESAPLKSFEENITRGFERNGVIFPNIVNLEFIFNDESSKLYEFNRYLGVYVNAIELAKLEIDIPRIYAERSTWPNTPKLKKEYLESDEVKLAQSNPDGVLLACKNLGLNLSELESSFTGPDDLYFNYVLSRDRKLHLPKLGQAYTVEKSNQVNVALSYSDFSITATSLTPHQFATGDLVTIASPTQGYSGDFFVTRISDTQFSYAVSEMLFDPSSSGTASQEVGKAKIRLSDTKVDLGKFFGPTEEIYLQDIGETSEIGGNSHIAVELLSPLSHLDQFKLYHPTGTRIDAQGKYDLFIGTKDYSLIPNEGDFYAYNDYDNVTGYDIFYFSADGKLSSIANAIEGCLNRVRNRDFTAYAYDNYVFIKCNVAGDFDRQHALSFYSLAGQYQSIKVQEVEGTQLASAKVNFVGGSKEVGNRLIIDKNHLTKIVRDLPDLLVKTSTGWSKIKKVSTYADKVNDVNQLTALSRSARIGEYIDKAVITLTDLEKPSISYTQFQMRKKYKPSFGFLSLFPIKDLDFDFYDSEYLNFPEIDLYQHYFIPPATNLLRSGTEYKVIDGSVRLNTGEEYTNEPFIAGEETKSYEVIAGDALVVYDGSNRWVPIADANKELEDFEGFSILKDPTRVVPATSSDQYLLKTKYLNGLTRTEYDFYKENESKDFALRSKIIPYITKWQIKNGKDSRGNPYRLNSEIVFGRNNFSPDHTVRTQNPNAFTHEWFYVESRFNYLDDEKTVKQNDYYFDEPFDLTRALVEPDYFINYFTYTPTYLEKEVGPTQFRYSSVFKNQTAGFETFFKGFKVEFKDVIDPNTLAEDGRPITKVSNRFEDYKFSCLLRVVKEDFLDRTSPPLRFKVIEHKTHKFVLFLIEVVLGSQDQIDQYWQFPFSPAYERLSNSTTDIAIGNLFIGDSSQLGIFSNPAWTAPFETVNGDYRFTFEDIRDLSISNLSHALLYSIKNKKYSTDSLSFSNVKLTSIIDFTGYGTTSGKLPSLKRVGLENQTPLLSDEIVRPTASSFIGFKNNNRYFILDDSSSSFTPQASSPVTRALDSAALLDLDSNKPSIFQYSAPNFTYSDDLPLISGTLNLLKSSDFLFLLGGEKYYEKLFEKLAFARVKESVNGYFPNIEYESYSIGQGGEPIKVAFPNFYLEFPDTKNVAKINQVILETDIDRPSQFSFTSTIGYAYEVTDLSTKIELNRYPGNYEPISRDLLFCKSSFVFTKNEIEPLQLANVSLNPNIEEQLTLRNFNHVKVANSKILNLEADLAYLPVYPLIGEVAIGQADYFLLTGNWDWGFHKRYLDSLQYEEAAGTLRIEEDESFMGKILTVPEYLEIESFQVLTLAQEQRLESVDLSQVEIVIKERESQVDGYLNISRILTNYFVAQGITQQFEEFLLNSSEYIGNFDSIEAYCQEYIRLNLLKLYELEALELYAKGDAQLTSSLNVENINSVQFFFLGDAERLSQGYSLLKTAKINKTDRLLINFSIPKNLNSGLRVSPKLKIKFS